MECAADFQGANTLIKVGPHEPTDLTPTQTGSQLGVEEVIPDCVFPNYIHKDIQLFFVQNFYRLTNYLRRLHLVSGIDRNEPLM